MSQLRDTCPQCDRSIIDSRFDATFRDNTRLSEAEASAALRDYDAIIPTLGDAFTAAAFADAPRCRILANFGAGFNHIDVKAAKAAGVVVTNTPDVVTDATADIAVMLMLMTTRRASEGERILRAGDWTGWNPTQLLGGHLSGRTVGIVGMGRIGQGIAKRASGFDMRVLYHNRSRLPADIERSCKAEYVDFDTLFAEADHLVLVLPYSAATHHIVDAAALAKMQPTATLTNIARGGIVDEAALADALERGRLASAALDVFEGEPAVNPRLLALDTIVLTPHIASGSLATRRAMVALAVDNLIAALGAGPDAGRPPTPIRPAAIDGKDAKRPGTA